MAHRNKKILWEVAAPKKKSRLWIFLIALLFTSLVVGNLLIWGKVFYKIWQYKIW